MSIHFALNYANPQKILFVYAECRFNANRFVLEAFQEAIDILASVQIEFGLARKLISNPSNARPKNTAKPFPNEELSSVPYFVPKPPR